MSRLVVTEPGASLRLTRGRIEVYKAKERLQVVRLLDLEHVVVTAKVGLTAPAARALLERGVDVVFLGRDGQPLGRLGRTLDVDAALRHEQHGLLRDPTVCARMAREIIRGKIENQRRLLLRTQRKLHSEPLGTALLRMRRVRSKLDTTDDLASLRGHEGEAASEYFSVFGLALRGDLTFSARSRRPPRDEVNAMLSFGYAVITNLIHGWVVAEGLDPGLGALHALGYRRPALVLDLVEEWRPVLVDQAVVWAANTRTIDPSHFEAHADPRGPAVRFTRPGLARWINALDARLDLECTGADGVRRRYRDHVRHQVRGFADSIRTGAPYTPFLAVA